MPPAIALRPPDQVIAYQLGFFKIDVGIASFFNHHFLLIGLQIPTQNIDTLQVSGGDGKVKFSGITQPSRGTEIIIPCIGSWSGWPKR